MTKSTQLFLASILLLLFACKSKKDMENNGHEHTNALIDETSPYLLQHAHNPVDWMPWGDEALEKAEKEDKLLIISVGYAACHWCHVMEHESFEDSAVAAIMNEHFVCIKVDREERPDVDDVYMTACQLASGRGCGWPLNAFALADGRPVWAGTYFPKDQWMNVLNQFVKLKEENPKKLEATAEQITQGIQSFDAIELATTDAEFTEEGLQDIGIKFLRNIDFEYGGRMGSPKFPMPNNYEFLLQYHYQTGNERALEAVTTTLDKMAGGGIYDQIGGGFARYSVDSIWLAPHFEKMLYDNGQLISLYAKAFKVTPKARYKEVVEQTIDFANRELLDKDGGYYSSLDADSEGEEGKFYVWQASEIEEALGKSNATDYFKDYYSVKNSGNWEHTNILYKSEDPLLLKKYNLSESEAAQIIADSNEKLLAARAGRIRPGTDDKVLTSWNGLMIKGLVDAHKAFGNEAYKTQALSTADFIVTKCLQKDGRLNRNYKEGKSNINGFLDDYATTIDAFLGLYEITLDQKWLDFAQNMMQYVEANFYNEEKKMFFYTSKADQQLVARKMELSDNVIPASNSMIARNLHKLGTYLYNQEMIAQSRQMLMNMAPTLESTMQPNFYSNWCQLYATMVTPPYEVAILGKESVAKAKVMQQQYLPNAYFLGGESEGDLKLLEGKLQDGATMIYVCQNKVCKLPMEDPAKALGLIEK